MASVFMNGRHRLIFLAQVIGNFLRDLCSYGMGEYAAQKVQLDRR